LLDKYIQIKDKIIVGGQYPSTGAWYCKDLPANTPKEFKELASEMNNVLNELNKNVKDKEKK